MPLINTDKNQQNRRPKGMAVTALMALIAIIVIGPCAMMVYELTHYNLARQQLKACVDSAALTASCSTTSSKTSNPTLTHQIAMAQATYMFQQQTILNNPMTTTPASNTWGIGTPGWGSAATANQAQLYFQFLDPTTLTPLDIADPKGKIVRVWGQYAFVPTFQKFIGIGTGPYLAVEQGDGGLPLLDVVLCFDLSGSMDDFTKVSLVNRYSDGPGGKNGYSLPIVNVSTLPAVNGQGALYLAEGATNDKGIADNATYPMDIDSSDGGSQGKYFINNAGHGQHTGAPPPLTKATLDAATGGTSFTDCVVNLDGTDKESNGITINGKTFPADDLATHKGLGVLVEASRGNLESVAAANTANAPWATWGITPGTGWFQAYYQAAMSAKVNIPDPSVSVPLRHPIGDAIVAAQTFFGVLSNDADVHFGLVCFGSEAGVKDSPADGTPGPAYFYYTRNAYDHGLTTMGYPTEPVKCIYPAIRMTPIPVGAAGSQYSGTATPPITTVDGALFTTAGSAPTPLMYNWSSVVAEGGTNIADALNRALAMHLGSKPSDPASTPKGYAALNLGRKGATRAIVLFTDGLPNSGGDNAPSIPASEAVAAVCQKAGIPIYTIGLCLTPNLQIEQQQVLADNSVTYPYKGIAYDAANGGTFNQTTDPAALNAIFQNVARQLVQLVQ